MYSIAVIASDPFSLFNLITMKTCREIRLENMRALLAEVDNKPTILAERLNKPTAQISGLVGKNPFRGIGDQIAREAENAFNKPRGWLDHEHLGQDERYKMLDLALQILDIAQTYGTSLDLDQLMAISDYLLTDFNGTGKVDPSKVQQLIKIAGK